nr:hypothetical protein [Acidobacteriota bacterium]
MAFKKQISFIADPEDDELDGSLPSDPSRAPNYVAPTIAPPEQAPVVTPGSAPSPQLASATPIASAPDAANTPSYLDPDLDPDAYSPVHKGKTAADLRREQEELEAQRPDDKPPGFWRTLAGIGAGIGVGYLTRNPNMVAQVQGQIMRPGAAKVQKWAGQVNDKASQAEAQEKIESDARAAQMGDANLAHLNAETRNQNSEADNRDLPGAPPSPEFEYHDGLIVNKRTGEVKPSGIPTTPKPLTANDFIEVLGPDKKLHRMKPDPVDPSKSVDYGIVPDGEPKVNTAPELAALATDPKRSPEERSAADAALKRLNTYQQAGRPINNNNFTLPGLPTSETPKQQTATGDDYIGTLSPSLAAQVKAISEGRAALPPASARSQAAISLRNAVFHYDPQYSDQRAQIRKAFTTGPDGKNIGALNTATVHFGQLQEAAEAMKNGTFQPGNQVYNYIATKFGASAPTDYN